MSYTQIETLEEYVLVAQDRMEVTVFHQMGFFSFSRREIRE